MSRKPKRGYYVKGHFVHEGSELDLELKRQAKGDVDVSKSDLKRASDELQDLGGELLTLRPGLFKPLDLPESLKDALAEAKRLTNFEAKRRQMQYVGKLMRKLDEEQVNAIRLALQVQKDGSAAETAALHVAEDWRNRLISAETGDAALTEWMAQHPNTDGQQLRALIRQARKDAANVAQNSNNRAFREIFQLIKSALSGNVTNLKPSLIDSAE